MSTPVPTPPERLDTARLRLRPPRDDDAKFAFAYASDVDTTRYLAFVRLHDIEQAHEFLARCRDGWETGSHHTWVMESKNTGESVGLVELRLQGWRAELGYVMAPAFAGRGYMSEAVAELVRWALEQPHIFRVYAYVDCENPASVRVLEKAGLTLEGTLRRYGLHPNVSDEPRDCFVYAVVR